MQIKNLVFYETIIIYEITFYKYFITLRYYYSYY
jgi:hypothetical protein